MEKFTKKKICILMPVHWSYCMGGAEYQSKRIVNALSASGKYEIFFLARDIDPDYEPDNHKIIRINNIFGVRNGRLFADTIPLINILKRIKPDIIYQRVGSAYTGIGSYFAQKYGGKFVWNIARDDDIEPSRYQFSRHIIGKFIEKKFLEYGIRKATHIIAQTNYQAELLERNYKRPPSTIIYNFHPLPTEPIIKSSSIKVVWIANLKPQKKPEIFLSLVKELQFLQDIEFIMIGELQGGRIFKRRIMAEIKQINGLEYMGRLSQEDINEILSSAHIFVNTSEVEGFPNTFIQAWMRKVPVVSLSINPDGVFDRHEVGFCSVTFEKLINDVLRLIEDDDLRNKMGQQAHDHAIQNHSEKNIVKLLSLFEDQ